MRKFLTIVSCLESSWEKLDWKGFVPLFLHILFWIKTPPTYCSLYPDTTYGPLLFVSLPFVLRLAFNSVSNLYLVSLPWVPLDGVKRHQRLLFSLMFYYRFRDCCLVTMYVMTMRVFSNEAQCAGSNLAPESRAEYNVPCSYVTKPAQVLMLLTATFGQHSPPPALAWF